MRGKLDPFELEGTDSCVTLVETSQGGELILQPESQAALVPPAMAGSALSSKSWRWLLVALCSAMGGIATFAFLSLTSIPSATNCQNISPLSPDIERLSCAQAAAKSGNLPELMAGLHLVEQWTPDHPLYQQAQQWMAEWSQSVLAIAHQKILHKDLKSAVNLANQIPKSSPAYKEAQAAIASWQKHWQQSEQIEKAVQTDLQNQEWNGAIDQILALRESAYDYWSVNRANALSQQVTQEKQGRRFLETAKQLAAASTPEQLGAAIAQVGKINPQTYTWKVAQPTLKQWSETLLNLGFQRWQQKQLEEAKSLAQSVLPNPALAPEARNLLKLSQARQLAMATDTPWQATPLDIWNLMSAVEIGRQIKPESRFHAQAQTSLKNWQAQLQDVIQLHLAQLTANLGQRQGFEFAITQAQQVALNRPRRVQAQTLVAHWQREIERLEDQPYIAHAQQLAEPRTIGAFRAAIAAANQIPEGRVLRGEAQGLIYDWRRQIEVIEDQPFLTLARLQASQGNLSQAIQTATVIHSGRALYYQAQAAIGSWQAEIRRLEMARLEAARKAAAAKEAKQKAAVEKNNRDSLPDESLPPADSPISTTEPTPPDTLPTGPDAAGEVAQPSPPPPVYTHQSKAPAPTVAPTPPVDAVSVPTQAPTVQVPPAGKTPPPLEEELPAATP